MSMSVLTTMEGVVKSVTIQWDHFLVDAVRGIYSILMRSVVMVRDIKP